ncbi:uncharacterized protein RAG0_09305 [Rhynchosporium agropyri]|uniref:Uncharacterized protein n=1 Tax=Rhynchosporium agropyri TaxID=914238 RepID=A0A1E1KUV2_9HELO|nr:uncharacterized protein RAG0_09305 [Rhynchosporium agropyri]
MASWKEKGVVPDSDDEDGLDSQGTTNPDSRLVGDISSGNGRPIEDGDNAVDDQDGEGDFLKEDPPLSEVPTEEFEPTTQVDLPLIRQASIEPHTKQSESLHAASSPQRFKDPRLYWASDEEEAPQIKQNESFSRSGNGLPAEEEISKSYVQITSQMSSPLSSPADSQPSLSQHLELHGQCRSSESPIQGPVDIVLPSASTDIRTSINMEPPSTARRNFRQRNAIQLHPYVVEQEKFRQTFIARGIAPMRIASSPQEYLRRRLRSSSPASESQDMSFDVGESQQRDKDWDPPSSPPQPASGITVVNGDASPIDEEEEEFPDIDEILRHPPRLPKRPEARSITQTLPKVKHRLKTYSTKIRRTGLSEIQGQPLRQAQHKNTNDIFDVPASPPATSSPFPETCRRPRVSLSRARSTPKEPTPNTSQDDILPIGELPTPATSAGKPVPIPLDSGVKSDDPFASDVEQSASELSSSDETVQIRTISKKIRGVLPASHIRLDQTKFPKPTVHSLRDTESLSAVKELSRRGVALPRECQISQTPPVSTNARLAFLSDSEDDNDNEDLGFVMADDPLELESIFDQSRLGVADEDDRIDAMLPSKKRSSSGSLLPRKKRKSGLISGARAESGSNNRQARITDHLKNPKRHPNLNKPTRRANGLGGGGGSRQRGSGVSRPRKPAAPHLGILDVMNPSNRDKKDLPKFIRVAARTARSRVGKGRQSPSRKFIRLASREDTQDVQIVLQDWREGKIAPKSRLSRPRISLDHSFALGQIADNQQTGLPALAHERHMLSSLNGPTASWVRRLIVSKRQQSMDNFVTKEPAPNQYAGQLEPHDTKSESEPSRRAKKCQSGQYPARPAQLESAEIPHSGRHSASAFKSTKRVLDGLYRNALRRPPLQRNLQLNRFLADDDFVQPSIEESHEIIDEESDVELIQVAPMPALRKKRVPQRLDAGAANYRQASNPLIVDYFAPSDVPNAGENSKLLGLGKFGTNYPYHFDIFPLQRGIFFHQSTLIGSGRLADILGNSDLQRLAQSSLPGLIFAEKVFKWRTWDENVSSEIGVCFDWLIDEIQPQQTSSPPTADASEVIAFVLHYVQYNVRFDGILDRNDFMSRMIEVLQEFSSRLNTEHDTEQTQIRAVIELLSCCILLTFHLLKALRIQPETNSSSYDLENILKSIASQFVVRLVSDGLPKIRKLYDDLQYLSFRERGITGDHYAANGWLILIKVLGEARIPRGGFWDITNEHLVTIPIKDVIDAPTMEKIWYSIYTLLPMCEFDNYGVVSPGLRQTANFDNWSLPQQMLKQVSSLYKSNQRQFPGFNDYCRSLLQRCHYLLVEWGWWKCSAVVGAIFDFFASHNLAHLRNEEAHDSPPFLEQLDSNPSLAIEYEDRCFHIFLKILALEIKHLARADDMKSIRNLVARVLPNHDRQYPKDEVIHTRDLAALQNHHDLLCTLFWASPPSQRPSVALIQELVIADRSHNEACLINIRTWENLARFMVAENSNMEAYKPFVLWQSTFFSSLCHQFLSAEHEVRQQAESFEKSSGQATSESRVADTIIANKRSLIIPMCRSLKAMGNTIKAAKSSGMVREALNCDVLSKALDPSVYTPISLSKQLASDCIVALCNYMDQIKLLDRDHDALPVTTVTNREGESQDSLDVDVNWERLDLIIPLRQNVVDYVYPLIRSCLEAESDQEVLFMSTIVDCWARLVAIITEEGAMSLESFITRGRYSVFENRRTHKSADAYWPLFLAKLLKNGKKLDDFRVPGFVFESEWLLCLTTCRSISVPVQDLTAELQRQGYYLCTTIDIESFDQIQTIRAAIRRMSSILIDKTSDADVGLPQKQTQSLFSEVLGEVMKSIQTHLESLDPGSDLHSHHLQVARVVVADIKSYASDFRPLTDFFVHPSTYYWPHDGDPSLYRAGLVAYCLRLEQQPDKAAFELYYYLHSGWTLALVSNRMDNFISCIRTGMKWWDFTKFMLSDFVPAIITTGFNSSAWLLCSIFLPAISSRVISLLDTKDNKSAWVFESIVNILKMIMNGTIMQTRLYERSLLGMHPDHHGILAVAFRFWFAIALPIRQYATRRSQDEVLTLEEVADPLSSFIYHAVNTFQMNDPFIYVPEGQFDVHKGKYTDKFVKHIVADIKENWQFSNEDCFAVVVKTRSNELSSVTRFRESLREVLEGNLERYECAYPNKEDVRLEKVENVYIQDLYI